MLYTPLNCLLHFTYFFHTFLNQIVQIYSWLIISGTDRHCDVADKSKANPTALKASININK